MRERYQVDVIGAYNCIKQITTEEFAKKNGAILVTAAVLQLPLGGLSAAVYG